MPVMEVEDRLHEYDSIPTENPEGEYEPYRAVFSYFRSDGSLAN